MTMDIITAIAAATKSLELVKAIKDIDRQMSVAELKAKSAELLSDLADVKGRIGRDARAIERKRTEKSGALRRLFN
jgi:hypothetical protein